MPPFDLKDYTYIQFIQEKDCCKHDFYIDYEHNGVGQLCHLIVSLIPLRVTTFFCIPHKPIINIYSYLIKWSFRKSGCGYLFYNEYKSFLMMTQEINIVIRLVMTRYMLSMFC